MPFVVNKADFFLVIVTCVIQIPQIKQWEGYGYLTFFQIARFYRVINGIPLIKDLVVCTLFVTELPCSRSPFSVLFSST